MKVATLFALIFVLVTQKYIKGQILIFSRFSDLLTILMYFIDVGFDLHF